MSNSSRLKKVLAVAGVSLTALHFINKWIDATANRDGITASLQQEVFTSSFGNINYNVFGQGRPLVLIHDLTPFSSSFEWSRIVAECSQNRKVFVLDLPGCGYSFKEKQAYTAFLYTEVIREFLREIVKEEADVIATGSSSKFVLKAKALSPDSIHKIIMVNPDTLDLAQPMEDTKAKVLFTALTLPVVGTAFYNFCYNRLFCNNLLSCKLFAHPENLSTETKLSLYENAHIRTDEAKYLLASLIINYTAVPVRAEVQDGKNLFIIYGRNVEDNIELLADYKNINPNIIFLPVEDAKVYPQLETPIAFINQLNNALEK